MSLFENPAFHWRETYFVHFEPRRRPPADLLLDRLRRLDPQYRIENVRSDAEGRFESLTILCEEDAAGLDVTYEAGDEVALQAFALSEDLADGELTVEEERKLGRLPTLSARFGVYHFEQLDYGRMFGADPPGSGGSPGSDDEEFLNPAALVSVLEELLRMSDGVAVDPQSGAVL